MAAVVPVDDAGDPRIADFVGLRAEARRPLDSERAARGAFVVEGALAVRQLLQSDFRLRSILLTERGRRALGDDLEGLEAPVYLATQPVIEAVCGFHFHRGVLASAERRALPRTQELAAAAELLLVIEGVNDHENLGGLFRNAAAFGVDAVVLDPTAADPLYRRSVRVSMGHVLRVPFARATTWPADLESLRALEFELVALTPALDAEDLHGLTHSRRPALLVGSEGRGLTGDVLRLADRRVRIPMAPGVDSLNVSTAVAIALYQIREP